MTHHGVPRLVSVSSVGVGDNVSAQSRPARLLWPRIVGPDRLAEAERAEAAVRESGLDWTLVRPPRLVDGGPGPVTVGPAEPARLGSRIPRGNLARVLLDLLDDGRWHHTAVTVVA